MMLDLTLKLIKTNKYVLAVSGGVDSMVLLNYFYHNNYDVVVVSFDHQTRSETTSEVDLVRKTASLYNYPFYSYKLDFSKTGNFHEQARLLRYKHLEDIAKKYNTKYIVTAHHFDDLVETIIMRIMRGANLFSYSGMRSQFLTNTGFTLLKPFLFITKDEIYEYAKTNNVSYLEDKSNLDNKYQRNIIRNILIPKLINNSSKESLNRSILKFYKANNVLFKQVEAFYQKLINNSKTNNPVINLTDFINLNTNLQIELLSLLTNNYNFFPSRKHLMEIITKIKGNSPNLIIPWGDHHILVKQYKKLEVIDRNNHSNKFNIIISHNKPYDNSETIKICYNKLDFPIVIRSPKSTDYLQFSYGRKKLNKYLIDQKIGLITRQNLKVVTDRSGTIIAVPPVYVNKQLGNQNKLYLIMNPEEL